MQENKKEAAPDVTSTQDGIENCENISTNSLTDGEKYVKDYKEKPEQIRLLYRQRQFAVAQRGDWFLFIRDLQRTPDGKWKFTNAIESLNPLPIWDTYRGMADADAEKRIREWLKEHGCNQTTGEPLPYAPRRAEPGEIV